MKYPRRLIPILILVGFAGAALCLVALKTAYEPFTRLPRPGAPAIPAVYLFFALTALAAALLSLAFRKKAPDETAFCVPATGLSTVSAIVSAVLILAGTAADAVPVARNYLLYRALPESRFTYLTLTMLLIAGISMLVLSRNRSSSHSPCYIWIGFAACFVLILYYHDHCHDPVVSHYAFQLLALVATSLALGEEATLAFSILQPFRFRALSWLAPVWLMTALPSVETVSQFLLLLGLLIWTLRQCGRIAPIVEAGSGSE